MEWKVSKHLIFTLQHSKSFTESLFNLKFTAKQLEKQSKRCQKEEVQEKAKLKKVIVVAVLCVLS